MLHIIPMVLCELPGRDRDSSDTPKPEVSGLFRDSGRKGASIVGAVSVDLDLTSEAFEMLSG